MALLVKRGGRCVQCVDQRACVGLGEDRRRVDLQLCPRASNAERLPRSELAATIDKWPMEGPQTWEQRKWSTIARNRPFAPDPRLDAIDRAAARQATGRE